MQVQTTETFRVVSAGRLLAGATPEQVREQLVRKFKLNAEQLERVLAKPTVVKQGLTRSQAEKYLQALRTAGLDARLMTTKGSGETRKNPEPEAESTLANASVPPPQVVTQETLEELFADPIPRFPVSLTYRLGLIGVMVMSLVAPLIYLGLLLAVAGGLVWYLALMPGLMAETSSGLGKLLIATCVPFIAGVFLLFLARPLFVSYPSSRALPLERGKHKDFFHLVDLLCQRMNLPPVTEIRVDNRVNASMGPSGGLVSLLRRELTLTIGMPLVAGFSRRQLIGVIGHELGHYAQPSAMLSNQLVNTVNFWMASRAFEKDAWDVRLARWQARSPLAIINVLLAFIQGMIWLTRLLFKGLLYFNIRMTRHMSRQMEYDADRYEAWIAGSDAFEATAKRLHTLAYAVDCVHDANGRAWDDGKLMEDLPNAVAQRADHLSEDERIKVLNHMSTSQTSVWDTHPADNDRVRHAQAQNFPGVYRLELPARDLLTNFEKLCKTVTLRDYASYGITDPQKHVVPNTRALAVSDAREAADKALTTYFNGSFTLRIMEMGEVEESDQTLQQVVDEIRSKLPDLELLHEAFFHAVQRHSLQVYGQTCLAADIPIDARQFELTTQDLRDARATVEASVRELTRLRNQLRPIDQLFTRRILLALEEMAPEEREQSRRLLETVRQLDKLPDSLRMLSSYSWTLEGLLSESDEEIREKIARAIEPAASLCREGITQFLQIAGQVPVYLGARESTLREYALERGVIATITRDDFGIFHLAPESLMETAQQCERMVNYVYYRCMADLAKACEDQEEKMHIRPLKLFKLEARDSSSAA